MKMKGHGGWFILAGASLLGAWGVYFLTGAGTPWMVLNYAGWTLLSAGYVFIVAAIVTLRRRGRTPKGEEFVNTTRIVTGGLYGYIRHPLYFGWLLMYPSVMCFSQHGLVLFLGVLGTISMVMIAHQEDQVLLKKFGEPYQRYKEAVPGLNIFVGVIRKLIKS
jgi:protein-S-isoprenylcysteine O-methyltransferase Ste14